MKKLILALNLALLGLTCQAQAAENTQPQYTFKPGTYSATVTGHNAPVTVKVTVSEHRIEKIDASENLETIGVGRKAIEKVTAKILDYQSLGVDGITGATLSSFAVREGVKKALQGATQDMEALNNASCVTHPVGVLDLQSDVVIVGGGGSGLAAAISAYEAGARKVIILEKLGFLGGSTNVSEGALNAPDPLRQGKQGIEDSTRYFFEQTMYGGHDKGDPALVRHLTSRALDAVHWMEMEGVIFKDEVGTATGALWQRSHYPSTPSGNSYIRAFEKRIAETNGAIEVYTDAQVIDLKKEDGRITGVVAKNFGRTINVKSPAVVIATGGFGANIPLRQKVNTGVWKDVELNNHIGTTNLNKAAQGEGLILAEKYGAALVGLDDIQLHPCGTPGTGLMEHIRTSGRNRIFVNSDGERFVNEGAARDVLAKAIFAQKGGQYWIVVNHLRYPSRDFIDNNGDSIKNMAAVGAVVEANTLEELAQKCKMDLTKLKASIDAYNKAVETKTPDELGFVANNKADRQMTEGPWYASRKVPTVHHTMGGIKINPQGQVLDAEGNVIPGLYAAGEVTGGIHGSNRLGGNAIADCMVFGRTAGTNAVMLR